MTDKQKSKAMDKAIEQLKKKYANKPKFEPQPRRRIPSEETNHYEFCEDMQALGDATGTRWGGNFGEEL